MLTVLLLLAAAPKDDTPIPMPTCASTDECEVRWGRAMRWVLDRNPNIEQQNDTLIRTGPAQVAGPNSYQVTRIPDGGGRYTIDLRVGCANELWGCKWKKDKRDFTAEVMR